MTIQCDDGTSSSVSSTFKNNWTPTSATTMVSGVSSYVIHNGSTVSTTKTTAVGSGDNHEDNNGDKENTGYKQTY